MAALGARERENLQRDIVIWVLRLRDKMNEKQQEEFLAKAQAFAATLGPVLATDADLEPGGLQWPAQKKTRKAEFLHLIRKLQGGPVTISAAVPLPPEAVVSGATYVPDETSYVDPSLPLELDADTIKAVKQFAADQKKHAKGPTKKGGPSAKELRDLATESFADLGLALFDAIIGERNEEEERAAEEGEAGPDRPRPLTVAALTHPDVKKNQQQYFKEIPANWLTLLVDEVNKQRLLFNPIEDSFVNLREAAKQQCRKNCLVHKGKKLDKVPEDCQACVSWFKDEDDPDLTNAIAFEVDEARQKFNKALLKSFKRLYLGAEAAIAEKEAEAEMVAPAPAAFAEETKEQMKARLQAQDVADEARLQMIRRAQYITAGKKAHPTWSEAEVLTAVQAVVDANLALQAAEELDDEKELKKAQKAALAAFSEAEKRLYGKGKYKDAKPPKTGFKPTVAVASKEAEDEDEDEEDDEEYKPDEESDEEEDEDEDKEDAKDEKSGGAGKKTRSKKTPKTYSGAGTFAQPQPPNGPSPYSRLVPFAPRPSPIATPAYKPRPLGPSRVQTSRQQLIQQQDDEPRPRSKKITSAPTVMERKAMPGMFRPMLPRLAPPAMFSPVNPGDNWPRETNWPRMGGANRKTLYPLGFINNPHLQFLPRWKTSRTGGGCGCDPTNIPRDEDTPL